MTLLVTGAAGFIGSSVAMALLDRGEQVIGIDNLNDYYDPALKRARLDRLAEAHGNAFTFEQVDFGDQQALEQFAAPHRFDRIVHLGAQAGVRYSLVNPQAYVRSNLMGQINLLELARHREVEHFIYASSSSVYGGNKELPFRVEDRVDHPISLYAATKKADELMGESYAHLFRLPPAFSSPSSFGGPSMQASTPPTISSMKVKSRRMSPPLKILSGRPSYNALVKIHIAMSGRPHGP